MIVVSPLPFFRSTANESAKKILVAHRGASAYAPEHTLEAYRLAIEQGADYVEQDLQVTKDGALVCLHDLTLERTTNVEDLFPDRFRKDVSEDQASGRTGSISPIPTLKRRLSFNHSARRVCER
jgi:glycerophosphoryl diester phosphodiesterase